MFNQIEPVSKKDRIVTIMKEAIISGKLNSGDPLVEGRVAQQFGVGQPLVREALIELEHQGFVQRFPYRGTCVTTLTRDDITQIFHLRIELESLAILWAKRNAAAADVDALRELVEKMKQSARGGDLVQFYEHDLALHQKIWELSGNKYLVDALKRVVVPLFAFFIVKTSRIPESYVESAANHGRIVEAFETTDPAGLHELVRELMANWETEMLRELLLVGE